MVKVSILVLHENLIVMDILSSEEVERIFEAIGSLSGSQLLGWSMTEKGTTSLELER